MCARIISISRYSRFVDHHVIVTIMPSRDKRWVALAVVLLGQLMMILDATITNVALPDIQRDLGFSQSSLTWIPDAYMIAFGSFLLLGGRLGDLVGRARLFLAGIALFTASSVACGLAGSAGMLIGARFVQGLGAAVSASAILALIVVEFPRPAERVRAMSAYTFVSVAGGSLGLLAGGLLTQALNWHWIFFVNVPIGAVALALGAMVLERDRGLGLTRDVDVLGSVLVTLAGMIAIYAIIGAEQHGFGSVRTLGGLGIAGALFAAFVGYENRIANPILPLHIMRLRSLMVACGVRALMVCGMWTTFFLGALYFERVQGFSPVEAGAAFLPQTIVVAALSLGTTARLSERFGPRRVLLAGMVLLTAALGLLAASLEAGMPYFPTQGLAFALAGIGGGMSFMTLMTLALADVPAADAGVASGIINVSVQIAAAFGMAILGTVASSRTGDLQAGGERLTDALAGGYQLAFGLAALSVAAGIVVAVRWLREEERAPAVAVSAAA
jgi:EmrB/QacA subfamily drug resistance transporter